MYSFQSQLSVEVNILRVYYTRTLPPELTLVTVHWVYSFLPILYIGLLRLIYNIKMRMAELDAPRKASKNVY